MAQDLSVVGPYAFLVGIAIAIIGGIAGSFLPADIRTGWIPLILLVLGLIVGYMNIKDKHVSNFLIAAIALGIVGNANLIALDNVINGLGTILVLIVAYIVMFVAPAALVVSLQVVHKLAKGD